MARPAPAFIPYEEYLRREEIADLRHEYYQGAILAMAGGTGAHARISTNLMGAVFGALRGRPCRPTNADQRVRIPATGLATYSDLGVVCGPRIPHTEDRHALTNPTVLFEVVSSSTGQYDRGQKFDHYAQLPTLKHYVLVDSTRIHVDVYTRQSDDSWARRSYEGGESLSLPAIDITLGVNDLYDGWAEEREIDELDSQGDGL